MYSSTIIKLNIKSLTFLNSIFYKRYFSSLKSSSSQHYQQNQNDKISEKTIERSLTTTAHTFKNEQNIGDKHFLAQKLENRSLLKLSGSDVVTFLQGLVTNDVKLLEQSSRKYASMYCMMLNPQGRVLYDLLLYKIDALFKEESSIFVECDKVVRDDLVNILKKYKLRKKISISLFDDFSVWGVIPKVVQTQAEENSKDFDHMNDQNVFFLTHDPRINSFGYRLIYPSNLDATNLLKNCEVTKDAYNSRCLELGVSEGVQDLPPNNCFPLEANLVFLNGVSFSKGCYVGQELTARTHHTGVIRKRLTPLIARSNDESKELKPEQQPTTIYSETLKKESGKVRNWKGQRGLGLVRLAECLLAEKDSLILRGKNGDHLGKVETFIPYWWPKKEDDEIIKQILNKIEKK